MFDTPVLPRLRELLEEVRDGTIQIPAFQRGYVWSDNQRLRLMDSIWRGIPIGSLLVWRTNADVEMATESRIGPCDLAAPPRASARTFLVDGLQRITTLFAALMPLPEGIDRDSEGRRWPIYFDLDPKNPDDLRFHLRHGKQVPAATWMPLSCLFHDERFFEFRDALVGLGRRDLLDEARRLESRFRDYVVPVVPLVSDDVSLVTEAFTRVNSQGQAMDEGDMAHALTLRDQFSLNDELAAIADRLSPSGWEKLNRKTIIAAFKAIHGLDVYKAGADDLRELLTADAGRASLRALPRSILNAVDLLRSFGVCGPGSLPYAYQIVALVRAAHRLDGPLDDSDGRLRKWFFWTTYNEHFTGMTSGQLKAEFDQVEELILGKRGLDWIDAPLVEPVTQLRPHSVRSRVATLVLAVAGDRLAKSDNAQQQRLYGALGTDALHRLFLDEAASNFANRVLADGEELAVLRRWSRGEPPELPGVGPDLANLLRRNLLQSTPLEDTAVRGAVLEARGARLAQEERVFVEALGAEWVQNRSPETVNEMSPRARVVLDVFQAAFRDAGGDPSRRGNPSIMLQREAIELRTRGRLSVDEVERGLGELLERHLLSRSGSAYSLTPIGQSA